MFSNTLQPLFLLLFIFTIAQTTDGQAYAAVDLILLNCGSSTNSSDSDGRSWGSDEYAPTNAAGLSTASPASRTNPSGHSVPYDTARLFNSTFTYSFPVSIPGHKFLRLYFYPDAYSGLSASDSFFSVTANGFVLLSNFSAFLHSELLSNDPSMVKEFVVNVDGDRRINLTFSPNPNSFAFINGIEIVSLPERLYFRNTPIKYVPDRLENLENGTALETLYRLNVGGADVQVKDDSGMFRYWTKDDDYIFGQDFGYTPHVENHIINYTEETPPYTAPETVYRTSRVMGNTSTSLEWAFPVDSGFRYLLRFHFCEIQLEVTMQEERIFTISIDNQTAEINADVIYWTGGTGIPIFRDYITQVQDDGRRGKKNLRISLFPSAAASPTYLNALLNGLEIFKLSDTNRSLAAANPFPTPAPPPASSSPAPRRRNPRKSSLIYAVVGCVLGASALLVAVTFLIFRFRKSSGRKNSGGSGIPLPDSLCRHFTLGNIMVATDNFDSNSIIGRGGFGNVYRGLIDNGVTTVAVKRLNASSHQGLLEFKTEVELLSKLRHQHLVSLIGYCIENREMILVYDYMANGTLREHLSSSSNSPLNWKQRLQICLGAARGLQYLHTGLNNAIIHRDVKSTNILLDEKWVAKIADFGLSKAVPTDGAKAHVSTAVKGSVGYIDPEYWRLQQLTDKSDVYSFGVVLMEVLCARPAVIHDAVRDKQSLAEWARLCYRRGTIDQIVDSNLKGQIAQQCFNKYIETAIMCLKEKRSDRPGMGDVVWNLEFALQLQEDVEKVGGGGDLVSPPPFQLPSLVEQKEAKTVDEETFSGTSETLEWSRSGDLPSSGSYEKLSSIEDVFSKIKETSGR